MDPGAWSALHALVLADPAKVRIWQVPHWRLLHHRGGKKTGQVTGMDTGAWAALDAGVNAAQAGRLGANGHGWARLGVSQLALSACWALDEGSLGVVGRALLALDDKLALSSLIDNAALRV